MHNSFRVGRGSATSHKSLFEGSLLYRLVRGFVGRRSLLLYTIQLTSLQLNQIEHEKKYSELVVSYLVCNRNQ